MQGQSGGPGVTHTKKQKKKTTSKLNHAVPQNHIHKLTPKAKSLLTPEEVVQSNFSSMLETGNSITRRQQHFHATRALVRTSDLLG